MKAGDEFYSNGQRVFAVKGAVKTYYYKSGAVKAAGKFVRSKMEGEWKFYRETGELLQIGNFKGNAKHGEWIRYDPKGKIVYHEEFINGKTVKRKK